VSSPTNGNDQRGTVIAKWITTSNQEKNQRQVVRFCFSYTTAFM